MRYRLVVFDFDGTLCDTSWPIVESANAALRAVGRPERTAKEVLDQVGLPLDVVLGNLVGPDCPAAEVDALCDAYRARFAEAAVGRSPLFDGVEGALRALRGVGCALAVATSRSRRSLEEILVLHSIRDLFGALRGGGCVRNGKPHPEMLHSIFDETGYCAAECVMVGDTTYDLQMGRAAGAATCGVTWGSHRRAELLAEGPQHLVDDAGELRGLVE